MLQPTTRFDTTRPRAIAIWLFVVAAMILAIVAVGGNTRLTESGLSITQWRHKKGHSKIGWGPPPLTPGGVIAIRGTFPKFSGAPFGRCPRKPDQCPRRGGAEELFLWQETVSHDVVHVLAHRLIRIDR